MFEGLRRKRLSARGLASGRTRRKQGDSHLRDYLLHGQAVKVALFLLFYGALVALLPAGHDTEIGHVRLALIAGVILLTALIHLYVNHPNSFGENDIVVLIFGTITVHLALIKTAVLVTALGGWSPNNAFLIMPFALAPMFLSVLLSRNHGIYAAIYGGLWGCLLVRPDQAMEFLVFNIVSGSIGVYVTDQIRRRSRLLRAGLVVGIGTLALALLLGKIDVGAAVGGAFTMESVQGVAAQAAMVVAVGLLTSMVVGGILPVLEGLFGITTDISWIELADLNHPLMRQLSIAAPGTYHHCLMVGSLSEAAAEEIGANATMCRVCSYFHDVGKIYKPAYFIENQGGGENLHEKLTPTMSALVILSHVKDGVDLALKHKLNGRVIDVIQQHHGTSLVYYFYRKAVEQREAMEDRVAAGEMHPEDLPDVNPDSFRYPGPLPNFKESAIISLADAVESASRCLAKPSQGKIEQLVHDIIQGRMMDGQLAHSELTLTEIDRIGTSFIKTLSNMMHHRVVYPEAGDDDADAVAGGVRSTEQGGVVAAAGEGGERQRARGPRAKHRKAAPSRRPTSGQQPASGTPEAGPADPVPPESAPAGQRAAADRPPNP